MAAAAFFELRNYLQFTAEDEVRLTQLRPAVEQQAERLADRFYERILADPGARRALPWDSEHRTRLRRSLQEWLVRLVSGPWDDSYFEGAQRVGRAHVRIRLGQHYVFGAMNVLRQELERIVEQVCPEPAAQRETRASLGKVIDLELGIMAHTYREDLLAQKMKSERMAVFGQLAATIGHELRNPLGVIESSLHLLSGYVGENEKAQRHVRRISEQVALAGGIVTQLMDIIHDRPLARQPVDLRLICSSAVQQVAAPPGVKIELELGEVSGGLAGDAGQLRQMLINLVQNAVDAVGSSGVVRLAISPSASGTLLTIEDSGPGVSAEVQARLFEPLVTTKPSGVGLGLALVKRIVERHGGQIRCVPHGSPEGGARFEIGLPSPTTAP